MTRLTLDWITVDAADAPPLARFWMDALDHELVYETDEETLIGPRDGSRRRILFLAVPDAKRGKNRLHFDLRPEDQGAEVRRLEGLGARHIDIGQGDVTWVVRARHGPLGRLTGRATRDTLTPWDDGGGARCPIPSFWWTVPGSSRAGSTR